MERFDEHVYKICAERNTPEAYRHFYDRTFARFEVSTSLPWRLRLARRFSVQYRVTRRLAAY